jgi:hypothetical protein
LGFSKSSEAGLGITLGSARDLIQNFNLEHDPEKWKPVFRKDHAQTKG